MKKFLVMLLMFTLVFGLTVPTYAMESREQKKILRR